MVCEGDDLLRLVVNAVCEIDAPNAVCNLTAFHDRIFACSHDDSIRSKMGCINVHVDAVTGVLVPPSHISPSILVYEDNHVYYTW